MDLFKVENGNWDSPKNSGLRRALKEKNNGESWLGGSGISTNGTKHV